MSAFMGETEREREGEREKDEGRHIRQAYI
jgi:hypothetical protein